MSSPLSRIGAKIGQSDRMFEQRTKGAASSLPPCGGGLGRGVAAIEGSSVVQAEPTPHPYPPPQGGRGSGSRRSRQQFSLNLAPVRFRGDDKLRECSSYFAASSAAGNCSSAARGDAAASDLEAHHQH